MDSGGFNPAQFPPGFANAFNAYCQLQQLQAQAQPQGPPGPQPPPSQPEGAPPPPTQIPFFQQPYGYPAMYWQVPNYNVGVGVGVPGQFQQQQQPWTVPPSLFHAHVPPAAHPPPYVPAQDQGRPQGAAGASVPVAQARVPSGAHQAGPGPRSHSHSQQREYAPGPQNQMQQTRPGPLVPPTSQGAAQAARVYSDEEKRRVVADALRRGKGDGLSGKQILEKLQETHKHMHVDFKEFFLANLEALWSPHADTRTDGSSKLGATSVRKPDAVQRQPQSKTSISKNASRSSDAASSPEPPFPATRPRIYGNRPLTLPTPASHKQQKPTYKNRVHSSRESSSTSRVGGSTGSVSTHVPRKRRGGVLEDYHDLTRIPVLPDNVQPIPPRRDAPGPSSRFTDEDKLFFIQYLRWRLHEGPVPTKDELYKELATQTPHHNANAWKKHWADCPELPDKVYIAACKRAADSSSAPSTPGGSGAEPTGGNTSSELTPLSLSSVRSPPSKARGRGEPVTEADLRAMARYVVAKSASWEAEGTGLKARWKEFSERPENRTRRSHDGWSSAARDHADELAMYVQEFKAGAGTSSDDHATSSHIHSVSVSVPPLPPPSSGLSPLSAMPPPTVVPPPPSPSIPPPPSMPLPLSMHLPPFKSRPSTPVAPIALVARAPPPLVNRKSTTASTSSSSTSPNVDSESEPSRNLKRPAPGPGGVAGPAEKRQRRELEEAHDVYVVERQLKKEEEDEDDDVIVLSSDG